MEWSVVRRSQWIAKRAVHKQCSGRVNPLCHHMKQRNGSRWNAGFFDDALDQSDGLMAHRSTLGVGFLISPVVQGGYGVFTADNKYLVFDAAGNEQAAAALKSSKKKDNLKVKVSGEVTGETIKVASLTLQ